MKPKDRDWHAGRRTKYENGFPCLTRLTGPKRALPDGYPAAPAVPLLLPIVIVTLTGLEIPVKSTGRAAALNT